MTTILAFAGGVAVGVVYEKTLVAWKNRISKAAHAAKEAMSD